MGKMAWPVRMDRPARTVVSTQLGRETLVLKSDDGHFRRATVRECASFQSFPITYQFFGKSYNSKYKQAGKAITTTLEIISALRDLIILSCSSSTDIVNFLFYGTF